MAKYCLSMAWTSSNALHPCKFLLILIGNMATNLSGVADLLAAVTKRFHTNQSQTKKGVVTPSTPILRACRQRS